MSAQTLSFAVRLLFDSGILTVWSQLYPHSVGQSLEQCRQVLGKHGVPGWWRAGVGKGCEEAEVCQAQPCAWFRLAQTLGSHG